MRDSDTPPLPVVVGIDGSQAAIQAAEWAVDEAVSREVQLRHAPVLALGVWRQDLGEMPNDELERRTQSWERRYPAVHFRAVATRTGVADFLDTSDSRIQLAVIGTTDIDQVARLIGPHGHPILGHAECSVLIVRP